MARLTDNPDFDQLDPAIPGVKKRGPIKIPTIDQLMWPPQPRPWWELLPPPPPPSKDPSPYAPVPIIQPPPPPPREVDPPSRPPMLPFGPPYISNTPTPVRSSGPSHTEFVPPSNSIAGGLAERIAALKGGLPMTTRISSLPSDGYVNGVPPIPFLPLASQRAPGGLPALLAEVGAFDPSSPEAPPIGGLAGLIQEYLRNH